MNGHLGGKRYQSPKRHCVVEAAPLYHTSTRQKLHTVFKTSMTSLSMNASRKKAFSDGACGANNLNLVVAFGGFQSSPEVPASSRTGDQRQAPIVVTQLEAVINAFTQQPIKASLGGLVGTFRHLSSPKQNARLYRCLRLCILHFVRSCCSYGVRCFRPHAARAQR